MLNSHHVKMLKKYIKYLLEYEKFEDDSFLVCGLCSYADKRFKQEGINEKESFKYSHSLWEYFCYGNYGRDISRLCNFFEEINSHQGRTKDRIIVAKKLANLLSEYLENHYTQGEQ